MRVPAQLRANGDALAADGRSGVRGAFVDEGFTLGTSRIQDVERDWTKPQGHSAAAARAQPQSSRYSFAVTPKAPSGTVTPIAWRGECNTAPEAPAEDLGVSGFAPAHSKLACSCSRGPSGEAAQLQVGGGDRGLQLGAVRYGKEQYVLRVSHAVDGTDAEPALTTGYLLSSEAQPVAAVDVTGHGQLWLARSLPPSTREAMVCVAAALMLY